MSEIFKNRILNPKRFAKKPSYPTRKKLPNRRTFLKQLAAGAFVIGLSKPVFVRGESVPIIREEKLLGIGKGFHFYFTWSRPETAPYLESALQGTAPDLMAFLDKEATSQKLHDLNQIKELEAQLIFMISPHIKPAVIESAYLEHNCAISCGEHRTKGKRKAPPPMKTEDRSLSLTKGYSFNIRWKFPVDDADDAVEALEETVPDINAFLEKNSNKEVLHDDEKLKKLEVDLLNIISPVIQPAHIELYSLYHNCHITCGKSQKKMGRRKRIK